MVSQRQKWPQKYDSKPFLIFREPKIKGSKRFKKERSPGGTKLEKFYLHDL